MKDPTFPKLVVFTNAIVPLALLAVDAYDGRLGANPVVSAIHTTGILAILFLFLSLTITPLRLITGWNWLSHFRRMLGNFAFFYACVHLLIYFIWDRQLNVMSLVSEVKKRPFILYGSGAVLLMLPLAITSTNGMIKRLGSANWKRLHRLAYLSAILATIHYFNATKVISNQQYAFGIALLILFGYRILVKFFPALKAKPKRATPRVHPVSAAGSEAV